MNEPEWIKRIKKYHSMGKPSLHESTQNLIGDFISTTYWQVNFVVNKILSVLVISIFILKSTLFATLLTT